MRIQLSKFGNILISRQAGREAFAALQSQINTIQNNENLEVDFEGVIIFSPSWADEFLSPLLKQFQDRLILINLTNPSVIATLELLEKIHTRPFKRQ
ncbi:MAG: DUF4325 domain-containing protein [Candidatus Giovannonibacteria bacterium]|nr:DUF4325 domain-containing protein [Candidatus Giovannonibacteria bacterium]